MKTFFHVHKKRIFWADLFQISSTTPLDDPVKTTSLQNDLLALASESEGRSLEYGVIPRLDFYQRAAAACAVVHTLEDQPYGCFILHKGVIF